MRSPHGRRRTLSVPSPASEIHATGLGFRVEGCHANVNGVRTLNPKSQTLLAWGLGLGCSV